MKGTSAYSLVVDAADGLDKAYYNSNFLVSLVERVQNIPRNVKVTLDDFHTLENQVISLHGGKQECCTLMLSILWFYQNGNELSNCVKFLACIKSIVVATTFVRVFVLYSLTKQEAMPCKCGGAITHHQRQVEEAIVSKLIHKLDAKLVRKLSLPLNNLTGFRSQTPFVYLKDHKCGVIDTEPVRDRTKDLKASCIPDNPKFEVIPISVIVHHPDFEEVWKEPALLWEDLRALNVLRDMLINIRRYETDLRYIEVVGELALQAYSNDHSAYHTEDYLSKHYSLVAKAIVTRLLHYGQDFGGKGSVLKQFSQHHIITISKRVSPMTDTLCQASKLQVLLNKLKNFQQPKSTPRPHCIARQILLRHAISQEFESQCLVTDNLVTLLTSVLEFLSTMVHNESDVVRFEMFWASNVVVNFIAWIVGVNETPVQCRTVRMYQTAMEMLSIPACKTTVQLSLMYAKQCNRYHLQETRIMYKWIQHEMPESYDSGKYSRFEFLENFAIGQLDLVSCDASVVKGTFANMLFECESSNASSVQQGILLWASHPSNATRLLMIHTAKEQTKFAAVQVFVKELCDAVLKISEATNSEPNSLDADQQVIAVWNSKWASATNTESIAIVGSEGGSIEEVNSNKKRKVENDWTKQMQLCELCLLLSSTRTDVLSASVSLTALPQDIGLLSRKMWGSVLGSLAKLGNKLEKLASKLRERQTAKVIQVMSTQGNWFRFVTLITLVWSMVYRSGHSRSASLHTACKRVSQHAWDVALLLGSNFSRELIHLMRQLAVGLTQAQCFLGMNDLNQTSNRMLQLIITNMLDALERSGKVTWPVSPMEDPVVFLQTDHPDMWGLGKYVSPTNMSALFSSNIQNVLEVYHSTKRVPIWYAVWRLNCMASDIGLSTKLLRYIANLFEEAEGSNTKVSSSIIEHYEHTEFGVTRLVNRVVCLFRSLVSRGLKQLIVLDPSNGTSSQTSGSSSTSQSGYSRCRSYLSVVMRLLGAFAYRVQSCSALVQNLPWTELQGILRSRTSVNAVVNASLVLNLVATEILQRTVDTSGKNVVEVRVFRDFCSKNSVVQTLLAICFPHTPVLGMGGGGTRSPVQEKSFVPLDSRVLEYALETIKCIAILEKIMPESGNDNRSEHRWKRISTAMASMVKHCIEHQQTQSQIKENDDLQLFIAEAIEAHCQTLSKASLQTFRQTLLNLPLPGTKPRGALMQQQGAGLGKFLSLLHGSNGSTVSNALEL